MCKDIRRDAFRFGLGFLQRFLFRALVDADWTDTASFMNNQPIPSLPTDEQRQTVWNRISVNTELFLKSIKASRPIDVLRQEISDQCLDAAQDRPAGIYRMYVPTGAAARHIPLCGFVWRWPAGRMPSICFILPLISRLSSRTQTASGKQWVQNLFWNITLMSSSRRTNSMHRSSGLLLVSVGKGFLSSAPQWFSC